MLHTLSNCIFVRILPTQKTGVCKDKKVMLRLPTPEVCWFSMCSPVQLSKIFTERVRKYRHRIATAIDVY